jgi:predicted acylesterase/phospholipase RssA
MKYLVLGPASMGIYAMIGAMKSMESTLDQVKEISGSSAGSILALFLAVGLSVDDIIEASLSIDTSDFVKLNIGSFFNKFGFVELDPIREQLVEICGCDPTFSELDKKIYVSAFCLNTSKTEYFSKDSHPEMKVIDAVCMSIAIPLIFASGEYCGKTYVDGGTAEEYPMGPFLDKKPHEVACIRIKMDEIYQDDLNTPKDFLEALIRSSMKNRLKYNENFKLITIDIGDVNVFDFNMTYEDKLRLMNMGYTCEK